MQNLLLDRYSQVEAFNKAARLHITPSARRAVFLVETKQHKDENALATIRNIFSARTRDFITALDDSGIIVVRELQSTESYEEQEGIAMACWWLCSTTEAMTLAWVPTANVADRYHGVSDAYKEARTALWETARSFYADKNVFRYTTVWASASDPTASHSGLQHVCRRDPSERESLRISIDDETLNIIRDLL